MKTILVGVAFAVGLVSPILAQQDDTIYTSGNDVSRPKLIKDVKPQYTAGAMRRRVTGGVLLRCVVDRDGVPTRLEIIKPLDEELDRVSLEAMKQWRFEPGHKDGKVVLVQIDVMMAFSMEQKQTFWRRMWRAVILQSSPLTQPTEKGIPPRVSVSQRLRDGTAKPFEQSRKPAPQAVFDAGMA